MKKIVFIDKDEHNAIALARDGFKNIAVQVVRFIDREIPSGPDNEMVKQRTKSVVWQAFVPILQDSKIGDYPSVKEGISTDLNKVIAQAREHLEVIRKADNTIEQILTASLQGNEGINGPEK